MRLRKSDKKSLRRWCLAWALAGLAAPGLPAQEAHFVPIFSYRTGPYAPDGIPLANGHRDYFDLVNRRDGGIHGVRTDWEECETRNDTHLGVECYERLKHGGPKGAALVNPYSTGLTYQLIPRARVDRVPIHSMGYGRAAAADGRVFKWTFNFPTTYWSQASALVRYMGRREGGLARLAGKQIALVYHNSPYGKEPIPTLEHLAERFGYRLRRLAVDHPGQEQSATWLRVRREQPDWVLLWGWGVMNQVAISAAADSGYPMDRMLGVWWSASEGDVVPAGEGAVGYQAATFHAPGADFPVHGDILEHVYGGDREAARANHFGEVLYNRGMLNAMYNVESIRTAMERFGREPMSGAQVRWGMENLHLTGERLRALGMAGHVRPIQITCRDHEGGGPVLIQQWDGARWRIVSEWIAPMHQVVRPLVEEAALAYAREHGITPRAC